MNKKVRTGGYIVLAAISLINVWLLVEANRPLQIIACIIMCAALIGLNRKEICKKHGLFDFTLPLFVLNMGGFGVISRDVAYSSGFVTLSWAILVVYTIDHIMQGINQMKTHFAYQDELCTMAITNIAFLVGILAVTLVEMVFMPWTWYSALLTINFFLLLYFCFDDVKPRHPMTEERN